MENFDPYNTAFNYTKDTTGKDLGQVSRRMNTIAKRTWGRELTLRELHTVRYAYNAAKGLPRPPAFDTEDRSGDRLTYDQMEALEAGCVRDPAT